MKHQEEAKAKRLANIEKQKQEKAFDDQLELVLDDLVEDQLDAILYVEIDVDDIVIIDNEISVAEILSRNPVKLYDVANKPNIFSHSRSKLCEDIQCFTHTLNLVATVDMVKVLNADMVHKRNYDAAYGKLKKLWNLSNQSDKASNLIYSVLGMLNFVQF